MTTRRLAAILAADVAGFSAMMERDEEGTAARIRALRAEVIEPVLTKHHGRLVKTTGDGFLAEFASPVEAVRSALAIQDQLAAANGVSLRIGINLGDIIIEDDGDVLGDGVNVAARLEQIAEPGGIAISGWVHEAVAGKLDRSFEDRGEQQVKNIARPVRVYALAGMRSSTVAQKALGLPEKPSIAVLPFTNMSGDPEQEYLADGISEDLITELSRIRAFLVIARNSTFTYKGRAIDVKAVGRELGAQYIVEGSVRRAGNRVRVTAQLIEADTANHLWAEKYDCGLDAMFDVQDEITRGIAASTHVQVILAEGDRVARTAPTDMSTWSLAKKGFAECYRLTRNGLEQALRIGRTILETDPSYPEGHQLIAAAGHHLVLMGFAGDPSSLAKEALREAREAVRLDTRNEVSHWLLGMAISTAWRFEDSSRYPGEAIASAYRQALQLNPNYAPAYGTLGSVAVYCGEPDEAIRNAEWALRLNPRDPGIFYRWGVFARAHFIKGDFETSREWAQRTVSRNSDWWQGHAVLAASRAKLGDYAGAKAAVAERILVAPENSASRLAQFLSGKAEHQHTYVQALMAAGLPE